MIFVNVVFEINVNGVSVKAGIGCTRHSKNDNEFGNKRKNIVLQLFSSSHAVCFFSPDLQNGRGVT